MKCIAYRKGYKYQIVSDYEVTIPILPVRDIDTDYIKLNTQGLLKLKKGYAWDGPSGPTIDTLNFMRGSLVHDALYQLMRERHLEKDLFRGPADRLLRDMCRADGMNAIRAWGVYYALRIGGDPAADPSNDKRDLHAPEGCKKPE
jgi:hypothetical protein